MIPKKVIRQYSNNCGFGAKTLPIERDALLNIILYELYQTTFKDLLVFKGGTALKKVFFGKRYDTYRFSKDLDFNIIKDVSIDTLENFIDELTDNIYDNHGLDFQRVGNTGEGDYGFRSYSIKIKLRNPGFDIGERVTIKFDFAIRPGFDKPYDEYFIPNHYQDYLDLEGDISCLSETIESILYGKFLAFFGEEKRTEPKDFYDIVQILNKQLIQDKSIIQDIINSFDIYLPDARLNTIERNWNDFFEDQLGKTPDFEKTLREFNRHMSKYMAKKI